MFWNYLRNQVKQAILAGVSDAAAELEGHGETDAAEAIQSLRARILTAADIAIDGDAAGPPRRSKKLQSA